MSSNFGIKRTCDNCTEACAEKLPAWKCKALFRPSEGALKNRIAELNREVAQLKAIKDIDGIKKLLRENTANLAMILVNRIKVKNHG